MASKKRAGKRYPLTVSTERMEKMKEKCEETGVPLNRYLNGLIAKDLESKD